MDGTVTEDGRSQPGPGFVVAGRYRLLDTVGQGGMGVVWRAEDEVLNRTVAVKQVVIAANLPDYERDILRERVMREARAAARLHDPAAVTVYDVVTDGDSPYLVMELVDAASLAELVRDEGPLPPQRVAQIGLAVLGALEAAHAAGILHRDVKPGNVMVCHNGRVLLTDFGIASTQGDTSITQTGLLLGSPAYIAPERAQGGTGGPHSDLWSLGATLYTAVEGTPAYDADGALATLSAVVDGRRRPSLRAGALGPVLDAMLATDPVDRPGAAQTRRLLEGVLRADPAAAAPVPMATHETTRLPRYPEATHLGHEPHTQAMESLRFEPYDEGSPRRARRRRVPLVLGLVVLLLAGVAVGVLALTGIFTRSGTTSIGGGNIPVGWVQDSESPFSIYHPADWTRQSVPGMGSAYGLSPELYERVAVLAAADPLVTVKAIDAAKQGQQAGYHLVKITDNGTSEADIEWTESDSGVTYHLLERAYLNNNRLFTLLFFARDDTWAKALPDFQAISGTFTPLS